MVSGNIAQRPGAAVVAVETSRPEQLLDDNAPEADSQTDAK